MTLDSIHHKNDDAMEAELSQISANNLYDLRAVTWDIVKNATFNDHDSQDPIQHIQTAFPSAQAAMPLSI